MEKGLLDKTGKSLTEWITIVKATKLEKHGEILKFLKTEHDFTHGFANFVSLKARASDAASHNPDDLINLQYSKGKEHFKPIFDSIIEKIKELGNDIEIVPKKASVSIRRKRQFTLIQPSTKTRMDIGLKLNNATIKNKLKNSGNFGTMCTNRVEVYTKEDIDSELLEYIKQAYIDAD